MTIESSGAVSAVVTPAGVVNSPNFSPLRSRVPVDRFGTETLPATGASTVRKPPRSDHPMPATGVARELTAT